MSISDQSLKISWDIYTYYNDDKTPTDNDYKKIDKISESLIYDHIVGNVDIFKYDDDMFYDLIFN